MGDWYLHRWLRSCCWYVMLSKSEFQSSFWCVNIRIWWRLYARIYLGSCFPVLMHTGYCRPTASPPPPAIQELRATIRVLPPQDCEFDSNFILFIRYCLENISKMFFQPRHCVSIRKNMLWVGFFLTSMASSWHLCIAGLLSVRIW